MLPFLAQIDTSGLLAPILNVGAVGACLIILGIYYLRKDKKYDSRVDERIKASDERVKLSEDFRKEQAALAEKYQNELKEQTEKYRVALEKFSQTLDSVVGVLQRRGGGGQP